jgi:hypothetical protein
VGHSVHSLLEANFQRGFSAVLARFHLDLRTCLLSNEWKEENMFVLILFPIAAFAGAGFLGRAMFRFDRDLQR